MVVDDNATNRQILCHQSVAWKMQSGGAAGGFEALETLRAAAAAGEPYDLALLDMQMPGMDGMMLAKAIKADPAIARTRLIMLTPLGHRFSAKELRGVGLDASVTKPIKQSRLFDCLVDVMGRDKAVGTLAATTVGPTVPAQEGPPLPRLHVLIAEDNQVNQIVAVAQLTKLILVGVDDEGTVRGLPLSYRERDHFDQKIRQMVWSRIKPAPPIQIAFEEVGGSYVGRITVARGEAPAHLLNGVVYIRHGSCDVPAEPEELGRLFVEFAT